MNLRIDGNSIRFKISEKELFILLLGEGLNEKINIINDCFSIKITPLDKLDKFYSRINSNNISLFVSKNKIQELKDMGRDKKGMEILQDNIKISFQLDIKSK